MTKQEALEQAYKYVAEKVGDRFMVDEAHLRETSKVFVFHYHTKAYVQTRDINYMTVGQGPIIIDKEDGRIIPFGSAFSYSAAIEYYLNEKGKLHAIIEACPEFDLTKRYDLTITEVVRKWELIDVLADAGLEYVKPEIQGDTIWRIAKPYKKRQLEERIGKTPAIFMDIAASKVLYLYNKITDKKLAHVEVGEHEKVKYE